MFNLLGYKWGDEAGGTPSQTITWDSDGLIDGLDLAAGVTSAEMNGALDAAFQAWEDVAAVDFLQVSSGADLNLIAGGFGGDIAGEAFTRAFDTPGADFNPALFDVAYESTVTFDSSFRTWSPDNAGSGTDFFSVALHEIGHVLGLDHVSDPSQIMYDFIESNRLGAGDIEGVQTIYGTDPGDTPIPPSGGGGAGGSSGSDDGGGGGGGILALILGLFALVAGVFTGGAGAVAALAGRVAENESDDSADEADDLGHDDHAHDHDHEHYEVVPLEELPLPMIEFEPVALVDEEDIEESFFL